MFNKGRGGAEGKLLHCLPEVSKYLKLVFPAIDIIGEKLALPC
jgi:hypothetical protein